MLIQMLSVKIPFQVNKNELSQTLTKSSEKSRYVLKYLIFPSAIHLIEQNIEYSI